MGALSPFPCDTLAFLEQIMSIDPQEVELGSVAPDFSLESNIGKIVQLSDYRGHKHVVLYFMREFN